MSWPRLPREAWPPLIVLLLGAGSAILFAVAAWLRFGAEGALVVGGLALLLGAWELDRALGAGAEPVGMEDRGDE